MSCYAEPIWIAHPPFGAIGFASQNANADIQMGAALISAKAELAKEKKQMMELCIFWCGKYDYLLLF